MQLLDGRKISAEIKEEIAGEVNQMVASGKQAPHLVAVLVGNNPASESYVSGKIKSCKQVGFMSTLIRFDESVSEKELLAKISELNQDESVSGFIVQLPLPEHISVQKVTEAIHPSKDVDGFHPINTGRMMQNLPCLLPATPYGILMMLERYKIKTSGMNCVVIGRSNIVGLPVSILLARNSEPGNCTVSICHSRTKNIEELCRQADLIIAAMGRPAFVKADMVKEGAVVIDVGITRVESATAKNGYRLSGDVDFVNVAPKCSYITPVPGGVGPMTIAALLKNTLRAAKKEINYSINL